MSLNEQIKRLRIKRGISQEVAAARLGISRPSYDKIESGEKELTVSQAAQLAKMLGTTPVTELVENSISGSTKPFNPDKYRQMILYCIEHGSNHSDKRIPKTKLAKLLYLADFAWYYQHSESMSGLTYRKQLYGPVPNEYFRVIDELFDSGTVSIRESGSAFLVGANEPSDIRVFKDEEINLLSAICEEWKPANTDSIVEFTHKQAPWRDTEDMEVVPYELIKHEPSLESVYIKPLF